MRMQTVKDIREFFIGELKDEAFTIDKTGQKTIELIGASFLATEPSIFGVPNEEYIERELEWYASESTNIYDIYGIKHLKEPPAAWQYAADEHGNINSNYGHLIYSEKYYFQFQQVVDELFKNPNSRRAIMIYNRPSMWIEYNEGGKNDFVCTNAVSYYIRDDMVHAVVQMRSNDVVFGYKNDYAWQTYVLQQVCKELSALNYDELYPGLITWQVQNLHVYERHFDLVK